MSGQSEQPERERAPCEVCGQTVIANWDGVPRVVDEAEAAAIGAELVHVCADCMETYGPMVAAFIIDLKRGGGCG